MAEKKINKHELRTKETRELLLRSAETIFVRDGYEGAELGEIAALAGRTKGAIYAQFESKEDIFLALVEQRVTRYRTQMQEMLAGSKSVEESLAALRQFCFKLTEDQAWALLFLSSSCLLFAIRNPRSGLAVCWMRSCLATRRRGWFKCSGQLERGRMVSDAQWRLQ